MYVCMYTSISCPVFHEYWIDRLKIQLIFDFSPPVIFFKFNINRTRPYDRKQSNYAKQ